MPTACQPYANSTKSLLLVTTGPITQIKNFGPIGVAGNLLVLITSRVLSEIMLRTRAKGTRDQGTLGSVATCYSRTPGRSHLFCVWMRHESRDGPFGGQERN
jgi:hypothetical protein